MKNASILMISRSRPALSHLTFLTLAIFISLINIVQAQQTLCQQIGGNFVPNITIGTNESSVTLTSNLGISAWNSQKVVINGTLVIDSDFLIYSCSLKMGKNAVIRIDPDVNFQTVFSKYFRCGNDLWRGFVAMGGTSYIWFSHIEDANTSMDIRSAIANVVMVGNSFNRNQKGMFAQNIAVNALIIANTFDCTTPLNGSASPFAFAGVHLTNCPSAMIGRIDHPAYRNIFRNLSYGVRLSNSTTEIGLSTFVNNTIGVSANGSMITVRGADAGLTTNFSLNQNDIHTRSTSLKVFHCYLDSCKNNNITSELNNNREQVHIYDNIIQITNEPAPSNSKLGISLDRSKFGADDQYRNTIDRNHIVIHDFAGNNRRGMHIRGSASIHDFMRIDSNTIEVMKGGSNGVHTKFVDIDISAADNFKVTRNTIRSSNTYLTGNNRWGFFMVNGATTPAEGNVFWDNNISGVGTADDGCCAIHAEDAGPWSICSNTTDQTYRGFHFIGHCGKSLFGSNTIKNHNVDPLNLYVGGTGLFIQGHGADNGFLGDQECQWNTWAVTDYSFANAYTAILLGKDLNGPGLSTLQKNEFFVENLSDPHQAPIDRNPMENWFKTSQCLQTPTECVPSLVNYFDEQDEWVRDQYPFPSESHGVEEWQSTRYVLAKLMRYPELATGEVLDFKNAYNQSSAALFARFDSLMNALSSVSAGSQTYLSALEANIQSKQAEINGLDVSISDFENLAPGLLSNRAVLLGELAALSIQRTTLLTQNTSVLSPLLAACSQFNNTLPANQIYEQNQKLLNALAIQKMQGMELSPANKDALHAIAQQCIQIAGRTRSAAAAMLAPEEGAQYWQENPDENNCLPQTERDEKLQKIGLSLSPNPCSDMLHVQFEAPFAGNLIISDLSGRLIQQWSVQEKIPSQDIPVKNLNNGIYILTCSSSMGKLPTSVKFVILR
ncbi:MAG: T9SS type A sorting domain-containing protein [Saprospiraceae bacterium]|nr:T9SS type A sorting domain-containing protein [Saprospiraceae bacterium]